MKNSPEELKSEFITSFKSLLEESPLLKKQYTERVKLSVDRTSFYATLDESSYNNPEVIESYLNDVAFAILDLVLEGAV